MTAFIKTIGTGALLALALCGCNVGMAPEGPSPDQFKRQIGEMPPDKQIQFIQNSPMSASQKQQQIAAIQQKYGISASSAQAPPSAPIPGGQTHP